MRRPEDPIITFKQCSDEVGKVTRGNGRTSITHNEEKKKTQRSGVAPNDGS